MGDGYPIIKNAWAGKERVKAIFWVYYVLGSFGFLFLAIAVVMLGHLLGILWVGQLFGYGGFFTDIIWGSVSVWRCALNVGSPIWGYAARGVVVLSIGGSVYRISGYIA